MHRRYITIIISVIFILANLSCSQSKPTEEQIKQVVERRERQKLQQQLSFASAFVLPGTPLSARPKDDSKGKAENSQITNINVLDSQTGENAGIKFFNARVKATMKYWDGREQALPEQWIKFEKTDKGWIDK